jgi:hypothetical protein
MAFKLTASTAAPVLPVPRDQILNGFRLDEHPFCVSSERVSRPTSDYRNEIAGAALTKTSLALLTRALGGP